MNNIHAPRPLNAEQSRGAIFRALKDCADDKFPNDERAVYLYLTTQPVSVITNELQIKLAQKGYELTEVIKQNG